jgi:Ku protein
LLCFPRAASGRKSALIRSTKRPATASDTADELYLNSPYYLVPDGEVGQQAFAVIREAIRKEGMVALGRVVFTSREHVIALEPRGKGLLGITLRYPYEVRKEHEYFEDIPDEKVPKDMLELASHIVETKSGHFNRALFPFNTCPCPLWEAHTAFVFLRGPASRQSK